MKNYLIYLCLLLLISPICSFGQRTSPSPKKLPKWQARALEFASQRGAVTLKNYQHTLEDVLLDKQQQSARFRTRSQGWSPVGPTQVPAGVGMVGLGRVNNIAFHPTDPNTLFACASQGGIWKTTNRGQSWMPIGDNLPILRTTDLAIDPKNPDIMYVALGDFAYIGIALNLDTRKRNTHYGLGIYKTTDGGVTWSPTGLALDQTNLDESLIKKIIIHPTETNQLIAVGSQGIYKSTDGGNSWQRKYNELVWDLEQDPNNPQILYAAGGFLATLPDMGSANIMKTTDFGDTWSALNTTIPAKNTVQRIELAISPSDPDYVYALACNLQSSFYALYRSTGGGATWEERSSRHGSLIDALNTPNILGWTDGNLTDDRGQGTYDLALLVDPVNKDRIYTGGINAWSSPDGGKSWELVSYWRNDYGLSLHADQHLFKYHPQNKEFYVCNDGGIYRTKEMKSISWATLAAGNTCQDANGNYVQGCSRLPTQWENITSSLVITSFYRLGLYTPDPKYMVAGCQDNSTYIKQGDDKWVNTFGGDGMDCKIDPRNRNTIYGSAQFGLFFKSTNGGNSYTVINTDMYRAEQGAWTSPIHINPTRSNTVFLAMGNVYKSNDGGANWTKLSNFNNFAGASFPLPTSALAVSNDNQVIYAAKRSYPDRNLDSEVWASKDGGNTWQKISNGLPNHLYPTSVTLATNNPDKVWVTYSGFENGQKIYESTDGGATWTNISHNLPNIPANATAYQPSGDVLYIGTDLGVYYRKESEINWELYQENLPNVIVTDLEVHEATNKLYATTFGRGIWVIDLAVEAEGGAPDELFEAGIHLTPNPASSTATLTIKQFEGDQLQVSLIDITGK